MSIKLINRTRLPDKALKDVIKAVRSEINGIDRKTLVRVTVSQGSGFGPGCSGMAWTTKITLCVPRCAKSAMETAEKFYWVAAHEWSHIRDALDARKGIHRPWSPEVNGRRIAHDDRLEERRADHLASEALERRERHADAIITLALAFEALWAERKLAEQRLADLMNALFQAYKAQQAREAAQDRLTRRTVPLPEEALQPAASTQTNPTNPV